MTRALEESGPALPWRESAERLLESVPGVVSATVDGPREAVAEVRVWYEPTWPVGQVLEAVQQCLTRDADAELGGTRFRAVVALPDRRTERRPRPVGTEVASPVGPGPAGTPIRLVGHTVEHVQDGVVGVHVWIEWQGRTFSGAAVGPAVPPGSLRTPALATLRALHACLQTLYQGPMQPGLTLEGAVRVNVRDAPVAVVALTASENARARSLTAAWPDEGAPELAMILATLHATARTVSRWLTDEAPASAGARPARATAEPRFTLVDFEVDRHPSGDLDVAVRLAGHGRAVDRRRNAADDEAAHLQLGAAATLDAVHELLRLGAWNVDGEDDLRHAGVRRVRTGECDVVVVLAEASVQGRRVPLAGATPVDGGLERASITAMLQATNPLVADPATTLLWSTRAGELRAAVKPVRA